jgi:hypothetical protein
MPMIDALAVPVVSVVAVGVLSELTDDVKPSKLQSVMTAASHDAHAANATSPKHDVAIDIPISLIRMRRATPRLNGCMPSAAKDLTPDSPQSHRRRSQAGVKFMKLG